MTVGTPNLVLAPIPLDCRTGILLRPEQIEWTASPGGGPDQGCGAVKVLRGQRSMRIAVVFAASSMLALTAAVFTQNAKAQSTTSTTQAAAETKLAEAETALQAGEADKALGLLVSTPAGVEERAEAGNLACLCA